MRSGIDPRDPVFVHSLLELYMYRRISDPGMGPYPPQVVLAVIPGFGFAHLAGGVDPDDPRFVPSVLEL